MTGDEATAWLEDLGLCLFLPRHAQLPAPAPSFVEAVHGAASAAPPGAALEHASEFTSRLVDERRIIPLNLLGTYSEQADFLITPEVLPWVAAVRGDRQWSTMPVGRTSPLVVRTWQVLDQEGEATAVQLRALLGRELTEAAVLRALIELWTTVRAMPVYKAGEPARWTLLKHRFPTQLATAANTGQGTALSALLSIYLRSAVAATAEEAEIFLSPLTARSRIREVIHGMMAARQFGSMSVGSQTLLFVEGSLPENLPVEEEAPAAVPAIAAPAERIQRAPKPPFRKQFQDKRRPPRRYDAPRGPRASFAERPQKGTPAKPWQRRPGFGRPVQPVREEGSTTKPKPIAGGEKRSSTGSRSWARKERRPGSDGAKRPGAKPWQRPSAFERRDRPAREGRSSTESLPGRPAEKRPGAKPWQRRPAFDPRNRPTREGQRPSAGSRPGPPAEKRPGAKPWQRRPGVSPGGHREDRRPFDRDRRPRTEGENRSGQKAGQKSGFRPSGPRSFGPKKPGSKRFTGPRPPFPPKREGAPAGTRGPGRGRPAGFGKPQRREGSRPPVARGKKIEGQVGKKFRKASPGERNPRKNRSQEENPE